MNAASGAQTEIKTVASENTSQGKRARRNMPRLSQNGIGESARAGVYWVARVWFRGVFYGRTLRGRRPQALKPANLVTGKGMWPKGTECALVEPPPNARALHPATAEPYPPGYRPGWYRMGCVAQNSN